MPVHELSHKIPQQEEKNKVKNKKKGPEIKTSKCFFSLNMSDRVFQMKCSPARRSGVADEVILSCLVLHACHRNKMSSFKCGSLKSKNPNMYTLLKISAVTYINNEIFIKLI